MKKTKMPKKGEFIKITERKCGGLQPHVQIGSLYEVMSAKQGSRGIFTEVRTGGKTMRVNSMRFGWEVLTASQIAEAKFKEECRKDADALINGFTKQEQVQIAIVPLIFYHIIWHYAMLAVGESVSHRVEILKKATRQIRETKRAYDRAVAKDLDALHTAAIERQTDEFMQHFRRDFTIMYFTVNGEFKKAYPEYPFDELRTYSIMALLFIRFVEAHNRRMDALIASRLGQCKNTMMMPSIMALRTLMECFAGIDERFDFDSEHIGLSMKIFANNVNKIEFDVL